MNRRLNGADRPQQRPHEPAHQLPTYLVGGLAHGGLHYLTGQTAQQLTRDTTQSALLCRGRCRFAC